MMITPRAYQKLMTSLPKVKDKTGEVAVIVAANNVLVTDITKRGELVLEHLDRKGR